MAVNQGPLYLGPFVLVLMILTTPRHGARGLETTNLAGESHTREEEFFFLALGGASLAD